MRQREELKYKLNENALPVKKSRYTDVFLPQKPVLQIEMVSFVEEKKEQLAKTRVHTKILFSEAFPLSYRTKTENLYFEGLVLVLYFVALES